MYKLTNVMIQHFEKSLIEFHKLFQGGRCQAWQLEELLAKAIRSDFSKSEKVVWKGNGHDIDADIIVNDRHQIQVKSGTIKTNYLKLSGHRLGRFNGDMNDIVEFLNSLNYTTVTVPYKTNHTKNGISHIYRIFSFETSVLNIDRDFIKKGKSYRLENGNKVTVEIHPSMSWQVWWRIPLNLLQNNNRDIIIN